MKVIAKRKSYEPQLERFEEVARMLGCDEGEAVFKAKLRAIAKPQPSKKPAKKKKRA